MTSASAEAFKPLEYSSHFNSHDIELNIKKLNRLNITDPYNAPGVLFKSISAEGDVPDLQYPDIYNYLINFPSSYSGSKSLQKPGGLQMDSVWLCNEHPAVESSSKKFLHHQWKGKCPSLIGSVMLAWLVGVRVVCLC